MNIHSVGKQPDNSVNPPGFPPSEIIEINKSEESLGKATQGEMPESIRHSVVSPSVDIPAWFIQMFVIMLIVTVLAIWLIPDELLLRWSMWWNNITLN